MLEREVNRSLNGRLYAPLEGFGRLHDRDAKKLSMLSSEKWFPLLGSVLERGRAHGERTQKAGVRHEG
jgi:hypothetical protein